MIQNVTSYYKNYNKMFENFMNTYKQNTTIKNGCFPANGHDIYNYVARYTTSNLQIQALMKLDGRLDFDKLKRAISLSVEAEPVFKCRFVEAEPPYWEPLENPGIINFCTLEETDDIDQTIKKLIQTPIDIDNGPMVKVTLIRSEQYDVLVFKINHSCCDGAGAQEFVNLLAEIYTSIDQENGTYLPIPRIGGRKDQDRLFEELGITNPDSIFIPGSDILLPMWSFPWEQSSSNTACMSVCRLPYGFLDTMITHVKTKGFTVNDFILTAYYRAMLEMREPVYGLPMEIPITIDLRRYLPDHRTQAIRNFSGSVSTSLIMSVNEPFSETLRRVSDMMKEIKDGYPGLQSALGLERIEKISFQETLAYYQASLEAKNTQAFCPLYCGDRCVPTLSNIGYMSKSLIKFGNSTVIDAYILPPVIRAPGLLMMANSYNSILTLAVGYYNSTVSSENIERLLNKVKDELIIGCES